MVPALLAIAVWLNPVANADTKIDSRTPEHFVVATLTSPFESGVVWHESEMVFVDDTPAVVSQVEDAYAVRADSPIRLRDGFSRRAVETVHARF